jgi:hypothetical protein
VPPAGDTRRRRRESLELSSNFTLVLEHHFHGMTVTLWQRH